MSETFYSPLTDALTELDLYDDTAEAEAARALLTALDLDEFERVAVH
jgi:hypothetical protein